MDATLNCDSGQDGIITDAQAAELLMRVSEQRPLALQNQSNVPYVQVQLAQTVEGITHLVEVPVSALGYLPSTLVYSTPVNSETHASSELATWVVEAPPEVDQQQQQQQQQLNYQQHHQGTENKFSDIVSASIEAIGFPESVTPGSTILSHAEQILIATDNSGQEMDPASAEANFDFDESSNSSMTVLNEKGQPSVSYPRPKRESIESRINRLLRGSTVPDVASVEDNSTTKMGLKAVKVVPSQSPKQSSASSHPTTSSVVSNSDANSTNKRPGRPAGRPVSIPTIYTSSIRPPSNADNSNTLRPGTDYFMPRGVSKRKAQNIRLLKSNPANPNCIDAEPAPPEETQVPTCLYWLHSYNTVHIYYYWW